MVDEAAVPRDAREMAEWFPQLSQAIARAAGHQAFAIVVLPAGASLETVNRDDDWYRDAAAFAAKVTMMEAVGHVEALMVGVDPGPCDARTVIEMSDGRRACGAHGYVLAEDDTCPIPGARRWVGATRDALDRQAVTGNHPGD